RAANGCTKSSTTAFGLLNAPARIVVCIRLLISVRIGVTGPSSPKKTGRRYNYSIVCMLAHTFLRGRRYSQKLSDGYHWPASYYVVCASGTNLGSCGALK